VPGEENFTCPLQLGLHDLLHPCSAANLRKRKEMTPKTATRKDAARTSDEAGATPPFDAPCVTVAVGSLPPQSRAARDPFGRVPEPEFRSCKTTFITTRKGERKDTDQSTRKTTQDGSAPVRDGETIEGVLGRRAEFSDDPIFPHLWFHYIVATAPFVS